MIDANGSEEGQISLIEHAESIAKVIDHLLHRPLGEAEEIHIGQLTQQDIIDQLCGIASKDIILLKAHGIRAAQADHLSVQIHIPLRNIYGIHGETAHTKGSRLPINILSGCIEEAGMQIIQVWIFGCP